MRRLVIDTLNPAPARFRGDQEVIARAEALSAEAETASSEIERDRPLLPALYSTSFTRPDSFRLLLPRRRQTHSRPTPLLSFTSSKPSPRGDASTASCRKQAGGCATAAAYLKTDRSPMRSLAKIRAQCSRVVPGQKAKAIETRTAAIASPACARSRAADRTPPGSARICPIYRADGAPLIGPTTAVRSSAPCWYRPSDVVWTDIWDTSACAAPTSDQFALNDHFVRARSLDHTRNFETECRESGPLDPMSAHNFYEIRFARVALRIARAIARHSSSTWRATSAPRLQEPAAR